MRTPFLCLLLLMGAGTAHAGSAWDMFVARCLDPFEHQSLPIVDGLDPLPVDQTHAARRVYGPSAEGYVLVLDGAPEIGERACAVIVSRKDLSPQADVWLDAQMTAGRYVPEGGWLMSHEWIEPRVMVRAEQSDTGSLFVVVETDLES